jgi:hypothetical protein
MRRLVLIFIGCLISGLTYGQILKIQTGVAISSLHARSEFMGNVFTKQYDPLIGNSLFLGLEYLDKKYYSLSTNIGYLRKGSTEEYQQVNQAGEWVKKERKQALDYVSINTMVDIKYPLQEKIIPFISLGPRIDYLLDDTYDGLMINEGINEDTGLNSFNYGMLLGGGITYDVSKFKIGLRSDYYLNAKQVVERPEHVTSAGGYSRYDVKDKTYTVNLIFGFKL